MLVAAGCGDDDESSEPEGRDTATAPTTTAPATTEPADEGGATDPDEQLPTTPDEGANAPASPEDAPGGAGDEVPASSQALFTGRGGAIRPRRVLVPPFIAIRVELRSSDGRSYSLRFGRRTITVGGSVRSLSRRFDGLGSGKRLVGRGPSGRVVIEASAEPGP